MLLNISKKTKIVCTIGPASDTKEMILRLYKAGMNVMRINFSHGEYSEQGAKIKIRNELEEEGIYIPWALDTKGPEIRCHKMENGKVIAYNGSYATDGAIRDQWAAGFAPSAPFNMMAYLSVNF